MPGFTIDFDSYDPDDFAAEDILAEPLPDNGAETLENAADEAGAPIAAPPQSAA